MITQKSLVALPENSSVHQSRVDKIEGHYHITRRLVDCEERFFLINTFSFCKTQLSFLIYVM